MLVPQTRSLFSYEGNDGGSGGVFSDGSGNPPRKTQPLRREQEAVGGAWMGRFLPAEQMGGKAQRRRQEGAWESSGTERRKEGQPS